MGLDHGEDLAAVLCILLGTVIIVASIFGSVAMAKDSKTLLICVSYPDILSQNQRFTLREELRNC